jgi:DNA helicase-2/ATP-dependent DNA helicase PcrA
LTLIINEQRERILEASGHLLVTGGPGSGKTTIALAKAQSRIFAGLEFGQSVLFLSFSRAAVARILEASKIQVSAELQKRLAIHTLHSFFWEILRAHGYLLGTPRRLCLLPPHDEKALRSGAEDDDQEWLAQREQLFRERGLAAFDLFAPKAHALLKSSQKICSVVADCFPLIIVDEAQDTAEDQWACVKLLAGKSQLMCLADLDQQIYDFLPGVSSQRVSQIMEALSPLRVDLEAENFRSPKCEIVKFGNDILLNTPRGAAYRGVSRIAFQPVADRRDASIRCSVGILRKRIEQETGNSPEHIAMLATWGKGVTIISRALTGSRANTLIPHQVLVDEAIVVLSSRLIAFLLEPKEPNHEFLDLAEGLGLAAAVFRAKGKKTHLKQAHSLESQSEQARLGTVSSRSVAASALFSIIRELQIHSFTGEPGKDWLFVRRRVKESGAKPLVSIAEEAEQLMAFQRGQRISTGLSETWQAELRYSGARAIVDAALAEHQLLSGLSEPRGINVMTIHKAKGKEFDGVVIFDDFNNSPLIHRNDIAPYSRSRRIFRVGITRARHHVLLLTDVYRPSALLNGHNL